jgi:hypothetical protein
VLMARYGDATQYGCSPRVIAKFRYEVPTI